MPANLAILSVGVIGALFLFFLAWRRPSIALTVWVISSVVFSEYILLPDARPCTSTSVGCYSPLWFWGLRQDDPATQSSVDFGSPRDSIVALIGWTIVSACLTGTIFRVDGSRNVSVFLTGFFVPGMILYLARSIPHSLTVLRTVCALLTVLFCYMVFTAFCEHFHLNSFVFPQYILDPSLGIHPERARGPVVNAAENGGIIAILFLASLHAGSLCKCRYDALGDEHRSAPIGHTGPLVHGDARSLVGIGWRTFRDALAQAV